MSKALAELIREDAARRRADLIDEEALGQHIDKINEKLRGGSRLEDLPASDRAAWNEACRSENGTAVYTIANPMLRDAYLRDQESRRKAEEYQKQFDERQKREQEKDAKLHRHMNSPQSVFHNGRF